MKRTELKRGKPLTRTAQLARGKPLPKKNAKRARLAWDRAFGSPERVQWIVNRPSVATGQGPCVNHHVRSRSAGGGYKDIVPMTAFEHRDLHNWGQTTFELVYEIDLTEAARRTEEAWRARDG